MQEASPNMSDRSLDFKGDDRLLLSARRVKAAPVRNGPFRERTRVAFEGALLK